MNLNKSLIFLVIFALVCFSAVFSVVSAQDNIVLGDVTSSDIDVSHTYSGAGSQFQINDDQSLTPVDVQNDDTNVNYNIKVDISTLDDSSRDSLNKLVDSGKNPGPSLVLKEGENYELLSTDSDSLSIEGNSLIIKGTYKDTNSNHNVNIEDSEVVGVSLNYGDCSGLGLPGFLAMIMIILLVKPTNLPFF